eukprot:scaffold93099_cov66-Phaeocystis_antarctica.AAC.7
MTLSAHVGVDDLLAEHVQIVDATAATVTPALALVDSARHELTAWLLAYAALDYTSGLIRRDLFQAASVRRAAERDPGAELRAALQINSQPRPVLVAPKGLTVADKVHTKPRPRLRNDATSALTQEANVAIRVGSHEADDDHVVLRSLEPLAAVTEHVVTSLLDLVGPLLNEDTARRRGRDTGGTRAAPADGKALKLLERIDGVVDQSACIVSVSALTEGVNLLVLLLELCDALEVGLDLVVPPDLLGESQRLLGASKLSKLEKCLAHLNTLSQLRLAVAAAAATAATTDLRVQRREQVLGCNAFFARSRPPAAEVVANLSLDSPLH